MPNPSRRTYRLQAQEVADYLVNNGISQAEFAEEAGISPVTLSQAMNGKPIVKTTMLAIAHVLGVNADTLIDSGVPPPTSTGNDTSPRVNVVDDVSDLQRYIGTSDQARSIAEAIKQAFAGQRPVIIVIAPAVLSLLCLLVGAAPIDARPFYVAGLTLAGVGFWLSRRRKTLLLLPVALIALNLISLVAWPLAVGIFPTNSGHVFGVGYRRPGFAAMKANKFYFGIDIKNGLLSNEFYSLQVDSEEARIGIFTNDQAIAILSVGLEPGKHRILLQICDKTVTKQVHVDILGKISEPLTFDISHPKNGRSTYGFTTFTQQIDASSFVAIPLEGTVFKVDGQPTHITISMSGVATYTYYETTPGWHDLTLLRDGKTLFSGRYYFYPIGESEKQTITDGKFLRDGNMYENRYKYVNFQHIVLKKL